MHLQNLKLLMNWSQHGEVFEKIKRRYLPLQTVQTLLQMDSCYDGVECQ